VPLDGLGMNFFCVDILDLETQLGERGEGNLIAPRYSPAASIRFRRTGEEAMVALEELLWFGRSGVRIRRGGVCVVRNIGCILHVTTEWRDDIEFKVKSARANPRFTHESFRTAVRCLH